MEIAHAIRRGAGVRNAPVRRLPWMAIRLMGLVNETYRELTEMRYLWNVTLQLDNRKLLGFLGEEPHTPLDTAEYDTLATLNCLPQALPAGARPGPVARSVGHTGYSQDDKWPAAVRS